jgi:hypothetical protein
LYKKEVHKIRDYKAGTGRNHPLLNIIGFDGLGKRSGGSVHTLSFAMTGHHMVCLLSSKKAYDIKKALTFDVHHYSCSLSFNR